MSVVLKASVILAAFAAMATLLSAGSEPGQPVSNALCAELRGGARGSVSPSQYTDTRICSQSTAIYPGRERL